MPTDFLRDLLAGVKPRTETDQQRAARLEAQLNALLARRDLLDRERKESDAAGKSAEVERAGRAIEDINARELPALEKEIRDARNAATEESVRERFDLLLRRVGNARSGICIQRETDISTAREAALWHQHATAKTTKQRRAANRDLNELYRIRAQFEVARDERARQDAERKQRKQRRREHEKRRKIGRMFRKM